MSISTNNDFDIDVALQKIRGYYTQFLVGYNADIDADVTEDVWTAGGEYVFPSDLSEEMTIVSDNAADTSNVVVRYLDADFNTVDESVTLNGTTPVPLSQPITRIQAAVVLDPTPTVGVVEITGNGNTYCQILPDDQRSNMLVYTVPAGKVGVIRGLTMGVNVSGGGTDNVIFRGLERVALSDGSRTGRINGLQFGIQKTGSSSLNIPNMNSPVFNEKTDIILSATPDSNNTTVSAVATILLAPRTTASLSTWLKN